MSVINAIEAFLEANTWDAAYDVIVKYPLLMSLDADIWLMQYAEFVASQGDTQIANIVSNRRWLLARCRTYGTDAVFKRNGGSVDGTQMEISPELLMNFWPEEE